eukprot:2633304-Rhodomonas_salina.1
MIRPVPVAATSEPQRERRYAPPPGRMSGGTGAPSWTAEEWARYDDRRDARAPSRPVPVALA